MTIWQQLKAGKIVPEMEEDAAVGLHPKIRSGVDCEHAQSNVIAGKGMIDDAVEQISKLWDEVERSDGAIAWEWIMHRSHHGGIIRGAEEFVDFVGSGGRIGRIKALFQKCRFIREFSGFPIRSCYVNFQEFMSILKSI